MLPVITRTAHFLTPLEIISRPTYFHYIILEHGTAAYTNFVKLLVVAFRAAYDALYIVSFALHYVTKRIPKRSEVFWEFGVEVQ